MTDEKTAPKTNIKTKRTRHANAQANYMERKRAEGKEWLATWVPGEAKECLKELIKRANSDEHQPTEAYIARMEQAVEDSAPDWAKTNISLLNIWLVATHNVQIDFNPTEEKSEKIEKKAKKEKKKKKKK
ncbi:hypothetical protein GCM10011332_14080 [Terasakiella brassicae]|uniref:Uncharacterized protein n=1 Tax=Terasakiella brassicae TaxID=1634917 RepID=A0A917BWM8_9PROT|nr:hypothetical protein [Terasakiella brassicae]GGF61485.1 hypothetical protein GCM10011332_14080 [Terasakiella brassicae]